MTTQSDSSVASRLLKAVIAKSFIEIALVCVVATMAAFSTFNPQLRGAIDVADQTRVAGWVHDPRSPGEVVEVQLFIDGKLIAMKRAHERRDDLVEAGVTAQPNHGFRFDLAAMSFAPGCHTVQVYALRPAAGSNRILLPVTKQPGYFEVSR
jgi:hypothetical protein